MAAPQQFRMSIVAEDGTWLFAYQDADGIYNVSYAGSPQYLAHLPKDWDKITRTWRRSGEYLGVFASLSTNIIFAEDGAAIINYLYNNGWIQGRGTLVIERRDDLDPTGWNFVEWDRCELDLSDLQRDWVNQTVTVPMLSGRLFELLKAYGSTKYNIPFWAYDSGGTPTWSTDGVLIRHDGIKLLYRSEYDSGATDAMPLDYTFDAGAGGFDHCINSGGGSIDRYTTPPMTTYTVTQNNGATTFIGNDILNPLMIVGNQQSLRNAESYDQYTQDTNVLKVLVMDSAVLSAHMVVVLGAGIIFQNNSFYPNGQLTFELVELDQFNARSTITEIGHIPLHYDAGQPDFTDITVYSAGDEFEFTGLNIPINPQHAYIMAIRYDNAGRDFHAQPIFTKITLSLYSDYNSGADTPISAPKFPASNVLGFRPATLWDKIVPCLETTDTTPYGFPIVSATPTYTAVSDALIDGTDVLDNTVPNTIFTTDNCLRLVNGQQYISMSVSEFHRICRNLWGMGLGIEGDTLRIEKLPYFFDNDTTILDLGTDVAEFKTYPFTDYAANNIKAGYDKVNTNSDFGIDAFCTEQAYKTPITRKLGDMDNKVPATTDQYTIEKARAQQSNASIMSPSTSNATYLIEITDTVDSTQTVPSPETSVTITMDAYTIRKYPTAQSIDSLTEPYIQGLYYPDDAYNLGLSPCRTLKRNSAFIHSFLQAQDDKNITYQTQYQMLFNTTGVSPQPVPGIISNLNGAEINEVASLPISGLDDKLFQPTILEFKSKYPVNLYELINDNPRGRIKLTWGGVLYAGFIFECSQVLGQDATNFKLLATTDSVI